MCGDLRAFLLAALCGVSLACASLEGARLYRSGTDALNRGDLPSAIADLERAASLVPHGSEIHNHLGIAYLEAGRGDEALRSLRRAVELDCENSAAQQNLRVAERRFAPARP
jgi:Flp pilus assembly protein TadD